MIKAYDMLLGVGGIGEGIFFALEGEHTLGRNESRLGRLLDIRDYCKLHIISHYVAVLLAPRSFSVIPIGRVGADSAGERMRREMAAAGMDVQYVVVDPTAPTMLSVCFQYPDGSGGNITTSQSACANLTVEDLSPAEAILKQHGRRAMVLAAPEVPLAVRRALLEIAGRTGAMRVAALAGGEVREALDSGYLTNVDLLALNEDEAGQVVGRAWDPPSPEATADLAQSSAKAFLDDCATALGRVREGMRIVMTAGGGGAYAFDGKRWDHCPAPRVKPVSTAGAGDAVLGGIMTGLAWGLPLIRPESEIAKSDPPLCSALELATFLGSMKVTSPHSIHPGVTGPSLAQFIRDHGRDVAPAVRELLESRTS